MVRIGVSNIGSFRCILDTGSFGLIIPLRIIHRLHEWGLNDAHFDFIGEDYAIVAGGGVVKTAEIKLREIQIGNWSLQEVPAVVTKEGDCLLGMSILRQFGHLTIDFGNRQLVLED